MCFKKLFENHARKQVNYSSYVHVFNLYGGGSMKAMTHQDVARIIDANAANLHQLLIENYHTYFWLYVQWTDGTWRKYMQNFQLNMNMPYFVAIDNSNINVLQQIFSNDSSRLQKLNDIALVL